MTLGRDYEEQTESKTRNSFVGKRVRLGDDEEQTG
jgi:hypothetical protein